MNTICKKNIVIDQVSIKFLLTSMNADELIENSKVAYHDYKNGTGYQRNLIVSHYRKIVKYFRTAQNPFIASSIILAINEEDLEPYEGKFTIKDKMRLVDGQHRVEAMKEVREYYNEDYSKISEFNFPVTILLVNSNDSLAEIITFIDINSKGKKVNTNLAITLRDKINNSNTSRLLNIDEFKENIATNLTIKLNSDESSFWHGMIKIGNDTDLEKPIGINAFCKSLLPLISVCLANQNIGNDVLTDVNKEKVIEEIFILVNKAWENVGEKWPKCFSKELGEKKFNIQKGIGVFPIHFILSECIKENNDFKKFSEIIMKSDVEEEWWKVGGVYSYYNSNAGFAKIAKYIKNDEVEDD